MTAHKHPIITGATADSVSMADGRAPSGQALAVPATPASAVDGPAGFDPSRIPYQPFALDVGQVWRSQGYAMVIDYASDFRGDPTLEMWRFANEDDGTDGYGWLEVSVHEIIETERSGTLAVYYRQWFAPDGEPAWGKRPQRKIGALGSLKSLIRRRKMRPAIATEAGTAETENTDSVHKGAVPEEGDAQ